MVVPQRGEARLWEGGQAGEGWESAHSMHGHGHGHVQADADADADADAHAHALADADADAAPTTPDAVFRIHTSCTNASNHFGSPSMISANVATNSGGSDDPSTGAGRRRVAWPSIRSARVRSCRTSTSTTAAFNALTFITLAPTLTI